MDLTEREHEVLYLRRRPGAERVTLRVIARRWGVSAVRVKQVEDNALRKVGLMYLAHYFRRTEGVKR